MNTKITVIGMGYVGLSNAVLLAQNDDVVALDISEERIACIKRGESPIKDREISEFLKNKSLRLKATLNKQEALADAEFVIVATPTDYDVEKNYFDTISVEKIVEDIRLLAPEATIVIKSTIPIGFVEDLRKKTGYNNIFFSPEFLREGKALYDNLHPSRIIVGDHSNHAKKFAQLMIESAVKQEIPVLFTSPKEAEAIKLFSNTYLAMRVAYFNELDNYCIRRGMSAREIIEGVSLDPRIGSHYNNPSLGYGGYCLPKDTKQLLANFQDIPQSLMSAIVSSNSLRKDFLAEDILGHNPRTVGIYSLAMKSGSDNYRASATLGIIERIINKGTNVIIYDPSILSDTFMGSEVVKDLNAFKYRCDIIICNRLSGELSDVQEKIYTRDLFGGDE
jgi:UDPglucose 6-dehydrogenase